MGANEPISEDPPVIIRIEASQLIFRLVVAACGSNVVSTWIVVATHFGELFAYCVSTSMFCYIPRNCTLTGDSVTLCMYAYICRVTPAGVEPIAERSQRLSLEERSS